MVGNIDQIVPLIKIPNECKNSEGWSFKSARKPQSVGNNNGIAYGGCVSALCMAASYQTLTDSQVERLRPYSHTGYYLGPTSTKHNVLLYVTNLRNTKSFATRQVHAFQLIENKMRACASVTTDFIAISEKPVLFSYSSLPSPPIDSKKRLPYKDEAAQITHHTQLPTQKSQVEQLLAQGNASFTPQEKENIRFFIDVMSNGLTRKCPPEGIWYHNYWGMGLVKHYKSPQEHLPLPNKRGYDWFKADNPPTFGYQEDGLLWPPNSIAANFCSLTNSMDAYMSYSPLSFSHLSWEDVQACSSLDFALRFHSSAISVTTFLLREIRTITAAEERGYDEARVWVEREGMNDCTDYQHVMTMTQATILRGKSSNITPKL